MPFIGEILKHRSVSIVGLAKNAGKTECLNYIIRRLPTDYFNVAVTSIGIDGETTDQVTGTAKPEITVREGMFFATSEKHFRQKRPLSELYDVSEENTALGRVVTAKALQEGKVLLSGPSSAVAMKRWMDSVQGFGIDLILVDGALSRLSTASPAVSEAMVLSTGAALSAHVFTKDAGRDDFYNSSLLSRGNRRRLNSDRDSPALERKAQTYRLSRAAIRARAARVEPASTVAQTHSPFMPPLRPLYLARATSGAPVFHARNAAADAGAVGSGREFRKRRGGRNLGPGRGDRDRDCRRHVRAHGPR